MVSQTELRLVLSCSRPAQRPLLDCRPARCPTCPRQPGAVLGWTAGTPLLCTGTGMHVVRTGKKKRDKPCSDGHEDQKQSCLLHLLSVRRVSYFRVPLQWAILKHYLCPAKVAPPRRAFRVARGNFYGTLTASAVVRPPLPSALWQSPLYAAAYEKIIQPARVHSKKFVLRLVSSFFMNRDRF